MCLAVPGKLIEKNGDDGLVDFQGSRVRAGLTFTPDAEVGDWLLVHAGYAINKLDADEAREIWDLLECDDRLEGQTPAELQALEDTSS